MSHIKFNDKNYQIKRIPFQNDEITIRSFENITYAEAPKHPIQKLHIFVPEAYYHGASIHDYDLNSALIFLPNTVGGYMPGEAAKPGKPIMGKDDSIFRALQHG